MVNSGNTARLLLAGAAIMVSGVCQAQSTVIEVGARKEFQGEIAHSTPERVLQFERRLKEPPPRQVYQWRSLTDLVDGMNRLGFPTMLDAAALDAAGMDSDEELPTVPLAASWRGYLVNVLNPLELVYCCQEEQLLISTPEAAEDELEVIITYDITPLVLGGDPEALIGLIQTTVDPDSWDDVGGHGSVWEFYAPNGRILLPILQTSETHLKIRDLLNQLARFGGRPVKLSTSREAAYQGFGISYSWGSTPIVVPQFGQRSGLGLPGSNSYSSFGGGFSGQGAFSVRDEATR